MTKRVELDEAHARPDELLDPDVRFLLANERTLLAWVRTALALVGGGLALGAFAGRSAVEVAFAVTAILLGAAMAAMGFARYQAADKAIRAGKLPAKGRGPSLQVIGVVSFALVVAVVELARI